MTTDLYNILISHEQNTYNNLNKWLFDSHLKQELIKGFP